MSCYNYVISVDVQFIKNHSYLINTGQIVIYGYLNADNPFRAKTFYGFKVVVPVLINDGIYIDTRLTGKPITYYQLSLTSTDWKDSIYHSKPCS